MDTGPEPDHRTIIQYKWIELVSKYEPPQNYINTTLGHIISAYTEENRHYHGLEHISRVLQDLDENRGGCRLYRPIQFAGIFHDFVHETKYTDNESRSATMADLCLRCINAPHSVIVETKRLILLTKHHEPEQRDIDGRILCDADMAILGAPSSKYDLYRSGIRKEYDWVPDDVYKKERARVLKKMVSRKRIYNTYEMFDRLERPARLNIKRELEDLR